MSETTQPSRHSRLKRVLLAAGAALIMLTVLLFAASALLGYGLNVRAMLANTLRALRDRPALAASAGEYKNIIFLHHSVGQNMIKQGAVREQLTQAGYQFWDHDYNWPGLSNASGTLLGYNYNVPGDNTDPDGLATIFSQPLYGLPLNTLSGLMQYDVIVFKSCFPASGIVSDEQLAEHKTWHLQIRDFIDQHPDKLFILLSQPPLNPAETDLDDAVRARAFANWLMSDEFRQGRKNIAAFDLFDRLAESDPLAADANMLRQDYREGSDSHPTQAANQLIGPQLAEFIMAAIEQYKQSLAQ